MRLAPMSITKVLTAAAAVSVAECFDLPLDYAVTVAETDAAGGSGNNLVAGDVLTLDALLADMMVVSSNVAARVIARAMGEFLPGGPRKQSPRLRFLAEMNRTAAAFAMRDSAFLNSPGFKAEGQYSTAMDLSLLMSAASRDPVIARWWGVAGSNISVEGPRARSIRLVNTNRMLVAGDPNILGGKTGTFPGQYNLALCSRLPDGDRAITVLLGAPDDRARYGDARALLDWVQAGQV
ncbi:serine hydrolase [Ciceribacter sp. RN22]|nr:serine hydrolase [Ciceribacter sp. RN22]